MDLGRKPTFLHCDGNAGVAEGGAAVGEAVKFSFGSIDSDIFSVEFWHRENHKCVWRLKKESEEVVKSFQF